MMKQIRYALSHCGGVLLTLCIAVSLLTAVLSNIVSQLQSAQNGIEVILVDTTLSLGGDSQFQQSIRKHTGVKYVGVSTVEVASANDYIQTIENYTMADYLHYLTISRNAEMIIVPEAMLEIIYQLPNIAPLSLEIPEEYQEICTYNGTVYAFPFRNLPVTDYEATLLSAQSEVYGVLLSNADHTDTMRQYLRTF